MACAKCGRENPAHARFCGGCGVALALRCPACGTACEADSRFCISCGGELAIPAGAVPVAAPPAAARKVVTVVFADLIGSVALHERLDAESGRRLMEGYHRAMAAVVEVHGGRVVQLLGDGVLAVFGVPRVAEDDAIRAVRAGIGMQRAYRELVRAQGGAGPLADVGLRVAVNTGEMVVGDDESVIGDVTNVAARLQHEARDGDVLVGEGTQRLVEDLVTLAPLGAFALRGRTESVRAWRVVSLKRPASARATPFVGRDAELARLMAVHEGAVAARAARLAVLLGSPGLGKSRLVAEVARRAGERATVLSARCDAAGGATFAPVAGALRGLLRIDEGAGGEALRAAVDAIVPGDDAERARIAAGLEAVLSGAPSSPEETFFALRRLLAALAVVRPVLLVVDDVHWAAPLLLDLLEHLAQWSTDVPLTVLAAARPELRDVRSSLASAGALVCDVVTLGGLDAASSMQLAAGVVGATELPAALVGRVLATSEGNPLFLAELVRMLVQDGVLRRDGERWVTTVEIASLDMPPTIGVLLAARLERLRPAERLVLERAAVVGRQFSRSAVAHLTGNAAGTLDEHLEALKRTELIEPDTAWFLGEPALRFHHVLIRDAAYRRVLKETRAELHERVAAWIAERAGDAVEHEETLGWHLEQAHLNLRELGALDARGRALGERAAHHLGAAGRRALARDDLALAAGLLGRAIATLEPAHTMRAELAPDWCEALLAAGEVEAAVEAIAELERVADGSERLRAWHACFAGQLAALIDPQSLRATAERVSAAANALAAAGDAQGEAKAHSVHAAALGRLGAMAACEDALDRALAAARRARDRRRANSVLAGAPVAALWGPSPVTRASGRCLDVVRVLRITQGAPAVESVALRCQAVLEALRGRAEAARRMIASSRRMVEELGIAQQLFETDVFTGMIELLEGDAPRAEAHLAAAYAGLREHGLAIDAARAAALLGRALLVQGRAAEAEALSHESEALAGDDLKAAIAWRGVRAEALARRGEVALAVDLARAAVEIAGATDALLDHADARVALAAALRAAGLAAEADAEERRAAELWRAKGATLLLGSRGRLTANEPVSVSPATRRRRPRENLATAEIPRLEAALLGRDTAAIESVIEAIEEVVHHGLGVTWDRDGARASFAMLLEGREFRFDHLVIATLGDRLALSEVSGGATGVRRGAFDVGEVEGLQLALSEVDARGRRVRVEFFPPEKIAAALARLYARHAELGPEGAARRTAEAVARGVSAFLGVGEAAPDVAGPVGDVLAVEPDAIVVRRVRPANRDGLDGAGTAGALELAVFDAQGSLVRRERFAADAVHEALRRFSLLYPPAAEADDGSHRAGPRTARENWATAHVRRFDAALAVRDDAAFACLFAPTLEVVHHPTGATFGRDAAVRRFLEAAVGSEQASFRHEPLATLGDSLALCRVTTTSPGMVLGEVDAGAFEIGSFAVIETDREVRATRVEVFADDRLGDALCALYRRGAELCAGSADAQRMQTVAAAVAAVLPMDQDAIRGVLAPDVAFTDHRRLGLGATQGAERYLRGLRSLTDLVTDAVAHTAGVLHADEHALLLHRRTTGVDRASGGAFELDMLMLWLFGDGGRISHVELFDADDTPLAATRVRVARAATAGGRDAPLDNAATRAERRFRMALEALDRAALEDLFAPGFTVVDRRRSGLFESDRAGFLESFWPMLESFASLRSDVRHLATRGDRLALARVRWLTGGREQAGPSEFEWLSVVEVDEDGRLVFEVDFDEDDAEAAYDELDARYLAGEGAAHRLVSGFMHGFSRALARRDWRALAETCAVDVVVADHRRLGWEPLRGATAYVDALRALVDLAPDTRMRLDHVETCPGAFLVRVAWTGTRDGGPFEEPSMIVGEVDRDGRMRRLDQYDDGDVATARARFAELGAAADPLARWLRPNAAVRARDRAEAALRARDWPAMQAVFAPDARIDDRRRLLGSSAPAIATVAALRGGVAVGATDLRTERRLLATYGDRVSIDNELWRAGGSDAPIEVEMLAVFEVDRDGRITAIVNFDPDDRRAAFREAGARLAALEPEHAPLLAASAAYFDAAADRDLERLRALHADDVVLQSWRRAGVELLVGVDACMESLRAMLALTETSEVEVLLRSATEPFGSVALSRVHGTLRDGGSYENLGWTLAMVENGRFVRFEQFELEDAERALARFAELSRERATLGTRELRIPPNAAARVSALSRTLAGAGDLQALRALCAPDMRWEDRRQLVRATGGLDAFVADASSISAEVWRRSTHTLVATVGDRLSLHHHLFTGTPASGEFEIEALDMTETEDEGRIVALTILDVADRGAASLEMLERYMCGEGARTMPPAQIAFLRAMRARDLQAARAALDDDFAFVDHRRTGVGRLAGADDYVASLAAMFEQSADIATDVLYHVAVAEHGSMSVGRMFGTLREGGGPFESVFVRINRYEDGRLLAVELFEFDDLERAEERFAALGKDYAARASGPLRIPANAAIRAWERWGVCMATRDWDALRRLFVPDAVWEDRRRLFGMTGDLDKLLEIARLAVSVRLAPVERSVVAAPGDRLLLVRNLFRQGDDEGAPDIEMLQLFETDDRGRFVSVVWFDPADLGTANLELHVRLAAQSDNEPIHRIAAFARAMYERDFARMRAALAPGLVYVDHRREGSGQLDGADACVAGARSLLERSHDAFIGPVFHVAVADAALLCVGRTFGTLAGGGAFESQFAAVVTMDRVELYDVDDLERARARFAELCVPRGADSL